MSSALPSTRERSARVARVSVADAMMLLPQTEDARGIGENATLLLAPSSAPLASREVGSPRSRPVQVDVLGLQGVLLDELAARLHLLAHQRPEHLVRLQGVLQPHLHQRPLLRVQRRL